VVTCDPLTLQTDRRTDGRQVIARPHFALKCIVLTTFLLRQLLLWAGPSGGRRLGTTLLDGLRRVGRCGEAWQQPHLSQSMHDKEVTRLVCVADVSDVIQYKQCSLTSVKTKTVSERCENVELSSVCSHFVDDFDNGDSTRGKSASEWRPRKT